jgi:hypothetical protein
MDDMTRLDALRALLAQGDPDDAKRTTRVVYAEPDPDKVAMPTGRKVWPRSWRSAAR